MEKIFRDWEYYWDLKGPTLGDNPEVIKMDFIERLPEDEKERTRQLVISRRISFEELLELYASACSSLVSRISLENKWRQITTPERKWKSIDLWCPKWLALAAEVDELGEKQIKEQLLRHIPKLIKEHILTLDERRNHVSKQKKLSQLLGKIESAYNHHPSAGVQTGLVHAVQQTSSRKSPKSPSTDCKTRYPRLKPKSSSP